MSVAAIAAPVHARLAPARSGSLPAPGQLELGEGFVALVTAPGTPWLPNAIVLGPGPTVVWDPVVAPIEPGPALAGARGGDPARARRRRPPRSPAPLSAEAPRASPPRAAVAALFAALRSGDVAARRRAALALLGRGPGLTPEGDDLLAGAAAVAAAAGDPLALPPALRTLTTPLSATLLELAARRAPRRAPVHALLDLADEHWRAAAARARRPRRLERARDRARGRRGGRGARRAPRPAARCATLPV